MEGLAGRVFIPGEAEEGIGVVLPSDERRVPGVCWEHV